MENEKHYFTVGLFVLGGLALACATILWFSSFGKREASTTYAIYFDGGVSGLSVGSPVLFKGLSVGRVETIRFKGHNDDRIIVLADIADSAPVRRDTTASIRLLGITGASAVALENSGLDSAPLTKSEGDKYPVIHASASGLEKFFDELPQFIDRLSQLAERAERVLDDKNLEAFHVLLTSASLAVQDISSLTRQVKTTVGGHSGGEIQDVLTEAKLAMREIKMLAKSLREDPSKILRGPTYEGQRVQD